MVLKKGFICSSYSHFGQTALLCRCSHLERMCLYYDREGPLLPHFTTKNLGIHPLVLHTLNLCNLVNNCQVMDF